MHWQKPVREEADEYWCGPDTLNLYKTLRESRDTAADMYKVVMSRFEHVDGAIMCSRI